jgi:hypothetical protein
MPTYLGADVAGVDRRQISSNKTDASCICPKGRSSNRDAGGSSEARPGAPHAGTAGHRKSGRPWVSKKLPSADQAKSWRKLGAVPQAEFEAGWRRPISRTTNGHHQGDSQHAYRLIDIAESERLVPHVGQLPSDSYTLHKLTQLSDERWPIARTGSFFTPASLAPWRSTLLSLDNSRSSGSFSVKSTSQGKVMGAQFR